MGVRTKLFALAVVVLFLGSGITVSADGDPQVIGTYERFGFSGDLHEEDVTQTSDGLIVHAPSFSSELRIGDAWLRESVGAWSTEAPFELNGHGEVVVPGEDTQFRPFQLSTEPVFTFGANTSIEFLERPMWLSIESLEGQQYKLIMDDGDSTGQDIYISKQWLAELGIHRPKLTHENGDVLVANESANGLGYFVRVPHFSYVILTAADILVQGKAGAGAILPHAGQIRWYASQLELQIDVGNFLVSYQLFVETDWVEFYLPNFAFREFAWTNQTWNGVNYHVITIHAGKTPTTVHLASVAHNPLPAADEIAVNGAVADISWSASANLDGNWSVYLETSHRKLALSVELEQCLDLTVTACNDVSLRPGQTYYWQVKYQIAGITVPGPVWTFRTEPDYRPYPSLLVGPINDAVVEGANVTLNWTSQGHSKAAPVNFTVQLAAWSADPHDWHEPCMWQANTSCTLTSLQPGTRYSWRILSQDNFTTVLSDVGSFITSGTPPNLINNISYLSVWPANGTQGISTGPNLTWSSSNPNATYDVYVEGAYSFATENESLDYEGSRTLAPLDTLVCAGVSTSCHAANLSADTDYRWTIVENATNPANGTVMWFSTAPSVDFQTLRSVAPQNGNLTVSPYTFLYWDGPQADEVLYFVYLRESAESSWQLECVTQDLFCPPRDLAPGAAYTWKVEAEHNGTTYPAMGGDFQIKPFGATEVPKTMLFLHGRNEKSSFNAWKAIRNLLVGDANEPAAYDRVIPVGYYGGECGAGSIISRAENSGHNYQAHTTVKSWEHVVTTDSCSSGKIRRHEYDTHVEHLAYHVAWYIYKEYTQQGAVVDITGHSMGGLVVRYALAIVEMDDEYYDSHYDEQEFPRYCNRAWPNNRACRIDSADRDKWPQSLAIKDVVTWAAPHKGSAGYCYKCYLQTAQIMKSDCCWGHKRFLEWMDQEAGHPQTTSVMLPSGTRWTLVGSDCDIIVRDPNFFGMDAYWAQVRYEDPCYDHSPGNPAPHLAYYQDASTELDGVGVYWIAEANDGFMRFNLQGLAPRVDLLEIDPNEPIYSEELPRTGNWLWLIGTTTWHEVQPVVY